MVLVAIDGITHVKPAPLEWIHGSPYCHSRRKGESPVVKASMETKEQIVKLERKAGNVVIRQNGNILDRLFGSRRDATQRPVSMAGIAKTNEWVKRKCNQLSPTSVHTSCLRQKFDRNIEEEHPCDVAIVSPNQFHSLGKCRL